MFSGKDTVSLPLYRNVITKTHQDMVVVNAHVQDQHIWRLPYIMGVFLEKKKKKKKKKSLFIVQVAYIENMLLKRKMSLCCNYAFYIKM